MKKMIKNCNNFFREILKYLCNFHFTGTSSTNLLEPRIQIGSWKRGEQYMSDIIEVCLYIKLLISYFKPKYILVSFWIYFIFKLINEKLYNSNIKFNIKSESIQNF